jgi:regulator of replication initiation timing
MTTEKTLAQRLHEGVDEANHAVHKVSAREANVLRDLRDVFIECIDTIEKLEADVVSARLNADSLRSAVGELTEENELLTGSLHQLKGELRQIQPDLELLESIKQMQKSADDHIIITGALATADQLEARVALCVKACATLSDETLQYLDIVRGEGLFRYKKRHEAIVAELEQKYEKLLGRHESLGIRYDAACADLQRYDANYPPFDMSEIITQEQARELKKEVAELSEIYVDENDTAWRPPTAWAYAQVCRVKNEQYDKIQKLEAELKSAKGWAGE